MAQSHMGKYILVVLFNGKNSEDLKSGINATKTGNSVFFCGMQQILRQMANLVAWH